MCSGVERRKEETKPPTEEEMLKILAGADKKDCERICAEYGFRLQRHPQDVEADERERWGGGGPVTQRRRHIRRKRFQQVIWKTASNSSWKQKLKKTLRQHSSQLMWRWEMSHCCFVIFCFTRWCIFRSPRRTSLKDPNILVNVASLLHAFPSPSSSRVPILFTIQVAKSLRMHFSLGK